MQAVQEQVKGAAALLQLKLPGLAFEHRIAAAASLSLDGARFMLAFFAACACGYVLRKLPDMTSRQLFALLSGIVLCGYAFGTGIVHGIVSVALNWAIVTFFPRQAATLGWLVNFPHLAACHALSGDTWKRGDLDFSGGMMMLALRVLSLCTNVADAHNERSSVMNGASSHTKYSSAASSNAPPPGLQKSDLQQTDSAVKQASEANRSKHIPEKLSPLDIGAYVFANGSLLGGPFFEYTEWRDFLKRQGPFHEAFHEVEGRQPPNSTRAALQKMAAALVYLTAFATLMPHFPIQMVWEDEFAQANMLKRLALLWTVGLVFKLRFYFVWTLSDANLTLAGFGFNGWQSKEKRVARWDRQTNGWPLQIETSASTATLMHVWNSKTSVFLREYVYEKLTFGSKKPGAPALVLTYLFSGVWHGLEPTYSVMFLTGASLTAASRVIYGLEKRTLPLSISKSWAWWSVKVLWTTLSMNYTCLAFHVYSIPKVFQAWGRFYYGFHLITLAVLLLPYALPKSAAKRKSA